MLAFASEFTSKVLSLPCPHFRMATNAVVNCSQIQSFLFPDCFRPEGPWDPDFERRVEENRFYSRPERQLLLSFIQVFGGFPVHGHFPGRCRGAGHGGKFRESCSPANITREELTEAGRVLEPDEYDSNPGMEADWSNYFDWTGDVPTVLERIVTHMNVNTLVLS
mmetsp:Transcript_76803/g.207013  ORF Transcript_76803/g.207013 Transcript_76803/m.207013 type:complete len:165 (-) Transcript_76803:1371-1865(-)